MFTQEFSRLSVSHDLCGMLQTARRRSPGRRRRVAQTARRRSPGRRRRVAKTARRRAPGRRRRVTQTARRRSPGRRRRVAQTARRRAPGRRRRVAQTARRRAPGRRRRVARRRPFLGHDVRVHREVYRMPESTTQLAMVSKLLLASEEGLGNWRGKGLADIEMPGEDGDHQSDTQVDLHQPPRDTARSQERPRRRQPATKKFWSVEEKAAVERHFSEHLRAMKVPCKADCTKVLENEAALAARTWQEVKNSVYTCIQKLKRSGR